jgi:GNAT superfamily N-acetyltransferase
LVWSTGELRAVYVDPDWTGLGVGGELIRTVERAARQRGLRGLFVESLPEAALFYTRCGYEVTGPVRVGIGGLHELAALRLEKVLLGGVQQSR